MERHESLPGALEDQVLFPRCEIFSGTGKTQGTDGEWQKEMRERKKKEIERE